MRKMTILALACALALTMSGCGTRRVSETETTCRAAQENITTGKQEETGSATKEPSGKTEESGSAAEGVTEAPEKVTDAVTGTTKKQEATTTKSQASTSTSKSQQTTTKKQASSTTKPQPTTTKTHETATAKPQPTTTKKQETTTAKPQPTTTKKPQPTTTKPQPTTTKQPETTAAQIDYTKHTFMECFDGTFEYWYQCPIHNGPLTSYEEIMQAFLDGFNDGYQRKYTNETKYSLILDDLNPVLCKEAAEVAEEWCKTGKKPERFQNLEFTKIGGEGCRAAGGEVEFYEEDDYHLTYTNVYMTGNEAYYYFRNDTEWKVWGIGYYWDYALKACYFVVVAQC